MKKKKKNISRKQSNKTMKSSMVPLHNAVTGQSEEDELFNNKSLMTSLQTQENYVNANIVYG